MTKKLYVTTPRPQNISNFGFLPETKNGYATCSTYLVLKPEVIEAEGDTLQPNDESTYQILEFYVI